MNHNFFTLFLGDSQNSEEEPENQGGWVTILPWLMLAWFYFLAAGIDPTPETTWSTFYREMLSTGEVHWKMFFLKHLAIDSYLRYVNSVSERYNVYLYLFQVEHLEVPSSQDKIFVFLHRGAIVGGKEVIYVQQEVSETLSLPMPWKCSVWMPLWYIHYKYNVDSSITPSQTLLEFQLKENTCIPVSYSK